MPQIWPRCVETSQETNEITKYMIEIFSEDRTRYYGRFAHFKAAKETLDLLREKGGIAGVTPSVLVMCYKGTELQRTYTATYNGRWRVPKEAKTSDAGKNLRARNVLCKQSKKPRRIRAKEAQRHADRCFRAGQPDWLTKPLPIFM